jgi:hypothetical protein
MKKIYRIRIKKKVDQVGTLIDLKHSPNGLTLKERCG